MIKKDITIINKLGLHARASAKFVSTASQYQSRIDVKKEGQSSINGNSIMAIMMLAASQGTALTFHIEGPDEHEMAEALEYLIANRFDEPE